MKKGQRRGDAAFKNSKDTAGARGRNKGGGFCICGMGRRSLTLFEYKLVYLMQ